LQHDKGIIAIKKEQDMNRKKSMLLAIIGNALALYNANLYGFFALLIAPFYFPSSNPLTSHIAALSAFAVGFIARPFGGLIFGHVGDTYDYKKAFTFSLVVTTISTFMIGVLPTYEVIGLWAPFILCCCLIAQGSCIAGAYTGASLLVVEYSKQHKVGFFCSLLPTSGTIGVGIAAALGAIVTLDSLPTWAWRVPFLFSLMGGILVFFMHHHVAETLVFKQADSHQKIEKYVIVSILKHHRRNFLCVIGISAFYTASFYIFMMYVMGLSVTIQEPLSAHQSMLINAGIMLVSIVSFLLMGSIADKIGIKRLMQYGSMGIVLAALPLFWFMHQDISAIKVAIIMFALAILNAGFVGPSGAFLTYLFPPQERYTGVGFGTALGSAIAGAITPLMILLLMRVTDNGVASALYLMFCAFIGWLCVSQVHLVAESSQRDDILGPDNYAT
jgi:MHS family proline/betaine transporter-like MFS transporter